MADPPVSADVGAAAVVVLTFVYTCRRRTGGGKNGEIGSESNSLFDLNN